MKGRYLEVTFRKGKPLAAYLYLPREVGIKSARTESSAPGLYIDYSADGKPIGLEITAPAQVTIEQINAMLEQLSLPKIGPEELALLHV